MNFKETRRGFMVLVNTLDKLAETGNTSRELALSKTAMQKAMMFTGTTMKFAKLGDNPYAANDGKRTSVEDIEPLFDATDNVLPPEILDQGLIYTIDQMRQFLDNQLDAIATFMVDEENGLQQPETEKEEFQVAMSIMSLYQCTTEARMWLGMELGRQKDISDLGN